MKRILLFLFSCCTSILFAQVSTIKKTQVIQTPPAAPVISGLICGSAPMKVWDKTFGGNAYDAINTMITTADGGYLLGGTSGSDISADKSQAPQGIWDFWIVKTDANGTKLWDKRFGGDSYQEVRSILPTADGGYLLSGFSFSGASGDKTEASHGQSDYWLVKIDFNGNKLWDKRFGGSGEDALRRVCATTDGGFLLGGGSNSAISGDRTEDSRGDSDYWVVKIDVNGNKVWDKRFGGSNNDALTSIVKTDDGFYLLGGVSASGISGDRTEDSRGGQDYWLVKIDGNGNKLWDRRFGGSATDWMDVLLPTSDGNYLLGGQSMSGVSGDRTQPSQGGYDFWIVKVDPNGNKLWDKRYGGNMFDIPTAMVTDTDGGYLLSGYSDSDATGDRTENSEGTYDFWTVKINKDGEKLWDKRFGGDGYDYLSSMIPVESGEYLLAGFSSSGISGDKTKASQGQEDFWVVKMTACQPATNFCEGKTYTLTATNCAGIINWSNGATGNSIEVNTAGTYTATCTVNNETSVASNSIIITPTAATLSGNATSGTNQAINTITSTQTIPTGINTTYQAGKSISLQGTFQAQTGSVFKAEIKGCE
ncbi:3-coathanger stack domain-containing protein [Emticicia sp. C21]|uniref:3-coathanger stack domain-containing protein n=1 Tax=Emticicia sp. C21 TaxID=2302915 RepID=UPI000E942229|nr:3-coathanger stack domain-containing protein [Emticicia sp. C21]RFS17063.1 T9SS C-terminal target domain-containing protein [Emticicia sp. C21]